MKRLFDNCKEFLCMVEGYHTTLKLLHWSATHNSLHVLTDDMDSSVLEYEDKIAECVMGITDTKFGIGDLKTLLPEAKTLDSLLKEMKKDVIEFKHKVGDSDDVSGLINILDDFMTDINKWNYLRTFA